VLAKGRQQTFENAISRDLRFIPLDDLELAWRDLNANNPRFRGMGGIMVNSEPQVILLHHADRQFGLQSQAQQAAIRLVGRHWLAM
jgi:hypothetical protein